MSSRVGSSSQVLPSSSSSSGSSDKIKRIAITNVDSWLGCCLTLHLAQELEKKCKNVEIIALARKVDHLEKLKKLKNVRLHEICYDKKETLEKAFHQVCATILIPEMDAKRVEQAKHVLCAMKNQGVRACMMLSVQGANEASQNLPELKSFHEIEKEVERECTKCFLILRKSILDQCFLLWSPIVQEKKELPLTVERACEMTPLDACDLVCAIETIIVEHCRRQEGEADLEHDMVLGLTEKAIVGFGQHHNRIYTLTGPQTITPEHLVQELSEIIGQKVEFKHVSREELKKYLESLKNRSNWAEEVNVDCCQEILKPVTGLATHLASSAVAIAGKLTGSGGDEEGRHHFVPNEAMIKLLLDEFELVKEKKAGLVSRDLDKILGHRGRPIKEFLKKEKDAFKPHRD